MALLFACDICLEDLPLERFLFYKCGHGYCSICIPQISGKTCPTCRKSLRKDNIPHRVYVTPVNTAEERADYLGHALNALGPESSTSAMNVAKLGMKMKSVAEELRVDQVTSSKLLAISNNMNERIAPLLFQLQEQKRAFQHSLPRVQLRADRAEKEAESLKQQLMEKTVTLVDKEKAYRDLWGCFEAQRRENERLKQMFAGIESTRGEAVHWDQNTQGSSQVANQTPVNPQPRPKNPEALKHILKILQILNAIHRKRNTPLPPALLGIPSPNYDPATSPFKDIQLGPTPGTVHVADKPINIYALFAAVLSRGGAATVRLCCTWICCSLNVLCSLQVTTPGLHCCLIFVCPNNTRHLTGVL
ncbi:hypothetical protein VKT23_018044 [Stygiomarasmius scandens]|uniref:RING-type domain-containing protein n=1 Tax=Marasmiellus scandens TaxID=2682957 RepID=A0ABR1IUP7_9AGAR